MSDAPKDAPKSTISRGIVDAVRACLRLVISSPEPLDVSQLSAIRDDLCTATAIVNGHIRAKESGEFVEEPPDRPTTGSHFAGSKTVILDLEDFAGGLDEGDANAPGGEYPIPFSFATTALPER